MNCSQKNLLNEDLLISDIISKEYKLRHKKIAGNKPLFTESQWTFPLIKTVLNECEIIGKEELKLDLYENQVEIISSEQMLDAYASIGMPIMYQHWSFGKSFSQNQHQYRRGLQGLAYEIVLNSNPSIAYLMEDNSMTMQTLVMAHACVGHNAFFKMNEFFRQWTDADGIIDYLVFAKNYIDDCEERYGYDAVERILDSAHALMNHGIDRYRRPSKLSAQAEKLYVQEKLDNQQKEINEIWNTLPRPPGEVPSTIDEIDLVERRKALKLPEENLLYFIEKKSPILKSWEREVVRIVRKIAQYFFPQSETKIQNEGFACFSHYYIVNRLHEKGMITDGSMLEFIHSHSSVLRQPEFDDPYYNGINPYSLGFDMYMDIKRICQEPTKEDEEWFPNISGKPWLDEIHFAMINFRDESFIRQYLSPALIRKWHMFAVQDDSSEQLLDINSIHNERGYRKIRNALANQNSSAYRSPDIQVYDANLTGDRTLTLRHQVHNSRPLSKDTSEVLKHVARLWGYSVVLESHNETVVNRYTMQAT